MKTPVKWGRGGQPLHPPRTKILLGYIVPWILLALSLLLLWEALR